jgi:exonuclease III
MSLGPKAGGLNIKAPKSRGVAILIKNKLSITVHDEPSDMEISEGNSRFVLGVVYGPNTNDEVTYTNLSADLGRFNNNTIILGGDWNATLDNSIVNSNIDVINMVNIPSHVRSQRMLNMCQNYNLTDPFRIKFLTRSEFTFVPSAANSRNRSRLDFFLVSESLAGSFSDVIISPLLLCCYFDHKAVTLDFAFKFTPPAFPVQDSILKIEEVHTSLKSTLFESYLWHADMAENNGFGHEEKK